MQGDNMEMQEQIAALEKQLALLKAQPQAVAPPPVKLLKLDIGCGSHKREGFLGVDQYQMPGVDLVHDVRQPWPWPDASVEEVSSTHFVEHLTALERIAFWNELHRVLIKGGKATIVVPHWSAGRAYGDPTHQWPPLSQFSFVYLNRDWRKQNAPHVDAQWMKGGFNCDFDFVAGYSLDGELALRNPEFVARAVKFQTEAAQDMQVTLTKK